MAEKMIRVQFSLPRDLRLRLERHAGAQGMTLSDCIREALVMDLDRPIERKAVLRKPRTQQSR